MRESAYGQDTTAITGFTPRMTDNPMHRRRFIEMMANLAKAEGDQVEAERLYRRAWEIAEAIGDIVSASIGMFNLALLYEDQGRLDEAVPLLERAVAIAERTGFYEAKRWRGVLERVRSKL